ncbi:MAG TPA: hypothetical protein VJS47_04645 [Rhizomicrobium sp.]|nr:hypothetical protein [Rhizomicrobium sp.]
MFRAMIFSFLAGVMLSQQVQDWASDNMASVETQLRTVLHAVTNVSAYEKIAAALR